MPKKPKSSIPKLSKAEHRFLDRLTERHNRLIENVEALVVGMKAGAVSREQIFEVIGASMAEDCRDFAKKTGCSEQEIAEEMARRLVDEVFESGERELPS